MIIEGTRILDRWLRHEEYGYIPMLETIGRQRADGTTDPAPPVPLLYNDVDNEEVAFEVDPPTEPALVLWCEGDVEFGVENKLRQVARSATFMLAYVTRDMPHLAASVFGAYTLRAAKKSLTRLNTMGNSSEWRNLNGVKLAKVDSVNIRRVAGAVGVSKLWGFIVITATLIDSEP